MIDETGGFQVSVHLPKVPVYCHVQGTPERTSRTPVDRSRPLN